MDVDLGWISRCYRGHSTRECEDWSVYFRPVKYNNGEANATASEVSEAKTIVKYAKQNMYGASEASDI